jgi:hypothetical protein
MEQPKIKMIGYLYNYGFGKFEFSDEFKEIYKQTYNQTIEELLQTYVGFDELFRMDKKLVSLYKSMEPKHINSKNSCIQIKYIPEELKTYTIYKKINNGKEYVEIDYNNIREEILNDIRDKKEYLPEHDKELERIYFIEENEGDPNFCEFI